MDLFIKLFTQSKHLSTKDDVCHSSEDCSQDSCCRDQSGDLVDPSGIFDHIGPILSVRNGTCVPLHAQFDENCGEHCPCDLSQGLMCYRTMEDNKFSPSVCRPKDVVKKWTKNFLDCWHDPKCVLPL